MTDVAPPFDQRNALEDALVAAAEDPAARGPFLRLLLDSVVYVLGETRSADGTPNPDGAQTLRPGDEIGIRSFPAPDGGTAIPFFTSEPWMRGCVRDLDRFVSLPTRDLFLTTRGARLVLNWGAPWAKEFTPDEISHLLEHGHPGARLETEAPRQVMLGLPAVEPTALLAELTTVFSRHPEVSAAYLGWFHDPSTDVPPHAIIGVEGEGDPRLAVEDAIAAVAGSDPVDFVVASPEDDSVGGWLATQGQRFYTRGGE
jgi:hypothetical protein